ncbi:MAG: glycosyltransferase family 87 protein, partial [Thermodesulfobacteriota bacterium]|nr:glycosyltransferase family 87 protein [Thermodesulfobacteriota bacterium]
RQLLRQAPEGRNILYVTIMALSLFRLAHQSMKFFLESSFIDLAYHYFYATMARLGLDLFDPEAIEKAKALNPMRFSGGEAVYSPSYFVFFQPLTLIPFPLLSVLWFLFCLLLVFIFVVVLLRHGDWDVSWLPLTFVCVIVATYQPLYEDLVLGQNNCLLLLFAVGAWYGFKKGRPWLSGFSLAAMAFIKIQFGALFIFTLLLNEKKVFLIASFLWLCLFLAGLPQLGVAHYEKYFFALQHHTAKVTVDVHNVSLNGLWHRLLGNDMHQATMVFFLTSLALFGTLLYWCYQHREQHSPGLPILLGITMIPLLSPNTEPHHLVVILLPLSFAALKIHTMAWRTKWVYALSVILLVSRYSWGRFASTGSVLLSPLLSLKMAGVLLLLMALTHLESKEAGGKPAEERPS